MSYSLVSLFTGCGGMDLGFKQAGFDVLWANDFFYDATETYKLNLGNHIHLGDITKVPSSQIPNDFDVLTGGFPCQGFSIANSKRSMSDQRNFLYKELLRVIEDKKPKVFVAENVKGLLSMEDGLVLEMILDDFKKLGYTVDYRVLTASDYGVPQNRERVIIMGNRIGKENLFPEPTHIDSKYQTLFDFDRKPKISVKEAISFLSNVRVRSISFNLNGVEIHNHEARMNVSDVFMKRKYEIDQKEIADYLKQWRVKAGISVKEIDEKLGYLHTAPHWFRKDVYGSVPSAQDWIELKTLLNFDSTYDEQILSFEEKKIEFDQMLRISNWETPSDTITASGPEIHPNKERRLSVRECAILQSFPMDFKFTGSISNMYKQIGNAVPPLLAYHIGMRVKEMLG